MHEQLISTMAKDLKIYKIENEPFEHYAARVIYSGLACWIKTATFDRAITETSEKQSGTSKKHIHDRCEKVLSEFIGRFPEVEEWFYPDKKKTDPVSLVRERLYGGGDLLNIGFQTHVGLIKRQEVKLTPDLSQIKGVLIQPGGYYSGVSVLKRTVKSKETESGDQLNDSELWLNQFIDRAWWKKGELYDEQMEYFDPYQPSRNNMLWKSSRPDYAAGLILARRTLNKSSYEYILEKREAGKVFHHRLDPFFQETREYRRVMFVLRKIANNPAPALATGDAKNVHLKLNVFLPNKEHAVLEALSWPCNSIDDKLEWDMPFDVWNYIKSNLLRLGLKVTEDIHG